MKTISTSHSYDQYRKDKDSSEGARMREIDHFTTRISAEVFRKSPQEKQETKTRMYKYPNKRHCPIYPNS